VSDGRDVSDGGNVRGVLAVHDVSDAAQAGALTIY